jgi:hypothetical protein
MLISWNNKTQFYSVFGTKIAVLYGVSTQQTIKNTKTKKDGHGKRGRVSEAAQRITSFLVMLTDPGNTGVAAPSNNVA